ncbi:hypothetical protein F8M41_005997 [Gigaspora margarita]|uniref:Uncharacterized protein n=1 Tax=Gigaspora margarita TaxID=4874 RepID=A0A8H4A6E1_GIGMA|nr:hypothetical protein F8M41_005997 [Gigaspora margarita]
MVIFHTVTSFAAFQYDQNNNIQLNQDPWLYSELTQEQYKSLFYLNLEMKNEMNQELHKYLQIIIDELIEEKNQTNSLINKLMNDNEQTGSIKKCLVCHTSNIINKKQLCSNCNAKLPTINELKLLNEPLEIANNTEKSFIFTSYTSNKLDKQIALKNKINIPQIFIPDPKNINPNSVANLKKFLIILKKYLELKKINANRLYAMSLELVWPYIVENNNPSVQGYLTWAQNQRLLDQYQGLDAILEEINKALKFLIPPIPSQHHWEIAARNCMKFIKLRNNFFNLINYHESDFHKKRTRPDFAVESCRFRVKIRKTKFLNPDNNNFQSINGEWKLSEEMKKFSELAQAKRIEFIQKVLINKNLTKTWHPIPITTEEADFQKSEKSLTRQEILTIIKSLIPYLNDVDRLQFKNLSNLSHNNLVIILQESKNILAENNINFNEET